MSFGMSSEALGNKRRSPTPDVANASDPHSENTSGADACLRLLEQDVQEDYCGEQESEVDNTLEARGGEGEGVTCDKIGECQKTRRKISGLKR